MNRKYGMRDGGFTGQKPQKLIGNQTKLDLNKDGQISKIDFTMMNKKKEKRSCLNGYEENQERY